MIILLSSIFIVGCLGANSSLPDGGLENLLVQEPNGDENPAENISKRGSIFSEGTYYPENKKLIEERFVGLTPKFSDKCWPGCEGNPPIWDESGNRIKGYFDRKRVEALIKERNPRNNPLPALLFTGRAFDYPQYKPLEYMHMAVAYSNPKGVTDIFFKYGMPLVKLFDNNSEYKGEIGLDVGRRKIVFFGNDKPCYFQLADDFYHIKIWNPLGQLVQDIHIFPRQSMIDAMLKYKLGHGVDYGYGTQIELSGFRGKGAFIKRDDPGAKNAFERIRSDRQKFILIDDKFLSYEYYEREYLHLLLEWQLNFGKWKAEMQRQLRGVYRQYNVRQRSAWKGNKRHELRTQIHQLHNDIQTIENSKRIDKLEIEVRKLKGEMHKAFRELRQQIAVLQDKIDNPNTEKFNCETTLGFISPVASLIPGAGTITSALTGAIGALCTIAKA